jgi:hypothetical protein
VSAAIAAGRSFRLDRNPSPITLSETGLCSHAWTQPVASCASPAGSRLMSSDICQRGARARSTRASFMRRRGALRTPIGAASDESGCAARREVRLLRTLDSMRLRRPLRVCHMLCHAPIYMGMTGGAALGLVLPPSSDAGRNCSPGGTREEPEELTTRRPRPASMLLGSSPRPLGGGALLRVCVCV